MESIKKLYARCMEKFWNSPLKTKLILLYFPVCIACTAVLCILTYMTCAKVLVSHVQQGTALRSEIALTGIRTELNELRLKDYTLITHNYDAAVRESGEQLALYAQLETLFGDDPDVEHSFYTVDGRCVYSSRSGLDVAYGRGNPEVKAFLDSTRATAFLSAKEVGDNEYIPRIYRIYPGDMLMNISYMVCHMEVSRFRSVLEGAGEELAFLLDENGEVLESTTQQFTLKELRQGLDEMETDHYGEYVMLQGRKYYANTMDEGLYGWKVLSLTSSESIGEQLVPLVGIICLVLFGYFVLTVALFGLVSGFVVKPLRRITEELATRDGEPFQLLHFRGRYRDEIGQLMNSFEKKEQQIQGYVKEVSLLEKKKREAETTAFAAQMNPHLLYNTLATVVWLIEADKKQEAVAATQALATLLHDSLRENDDEVSLAREIETLRNYISIQQLRYFDKFKHIICVDDEVLQYMIPRVVLQPLFENAIYHGIKLRDTMGLIKITGGMEAGDIVIRIADNGPADAEAIERINQALGSKDMNDLRIGVKNVHLRLRYRYGDGYGLSYAKRDGFTVATVRLPARRGEEDV